MKKFHLTDGFCTRFITALDLIEHLGFSESHAYKVINGDFQLKPVYQELLRLKLMGTIPGWAGWYIDQGKIWSPSGRYYTPDDLENYTYTLNLMKLYEQDMKKLLERVRTLESDLEKAQARELRIYVNDEAEPRQVRPIKRNTG